MRPAPTLFIRSDVAEEAATAVGGVEKLNAPASAVSAETMSASLRKLAGSVRFVAVASADAAGAEAELATVDALCTVLLLFASLAAEVELVSVLAGLERSTFFSSASSRTHFSQRQSN